MNASDPAVSVEDEADALLASLAEDLFSESEATSGSSDGEQNVGGSTEFVTPAHIPREVVDFVESISRSKQTAVQVLLTADRKICRRLGRGDPAVQSAKRWALAWVHKRDKVQGSLRRYRDAHAFSAHASMADASKFLTPSRLPKNLLPWRPNDAGVLVIDDPVQVQPSFGAPAFLEATPMKLIRYVYETSEERRTRSMGGDVCISGFQKPSVWDLTAGSGTVGDYLHTMVGCTVIESDLTPNRDHVDCASALQLGKIGAHTGFGGLAVVHRFVRRPDLVFFDPPSLGKPSVSRLYDGGRRGEDFAELSKDSWIGVVSLVSRAATAHLEAGGLVSLLVRHGRRRDGKVTPDPGILEGVKQGLARPWEGLPAVTIVSEMPLEFRGRRAQTSLGKGRVPATHLLLAKAEETAR